jgi:Rho-binding antiterminator
MNEPQTSYSPISCDFHDLLETLATTRQPVQIAFRDSAGRLQQRRATIADVYAKQGAEYLSIDSGETLRLDRLVTVDGTALAEP